MPLPDHKLAEDWVNHHGKSWSKTSPQVGISMCLCLAITPFSGMLALPVALTVTLQGILQARLEVVTHDAKLRWPGKLDVAGAFALENIGVIYHEGLFGSQAGLQNQHHAMAGFEHIQVAAYMRGGKAFFVEGAETLTWAIQSANASLNA